MQIFSEMISPGSTVVEIGGHIGYVTLYFAHLVGSQGRVVVFEPGPNNLPYLRKNIVPYPNITLVEKAVTDFVGPGQFHIESLSGQNNSLVDHYEFFEANLESAGIGEVETSTVEVPCTTLDAYLKETDCPNPSFVKVDVEGAESSVLDGLRETLQADRVALMVEATRNQEAAYQLLKEYGFAMFNELRERIDSPRNMNGNIFCVKANNARISRFSP